MSSSEDMVRKALEHCESLQIMIDISAKTLHRLRESLQCNPSNQLSQALREAETKLVKMFSKQLISKASVHGVAEQLSQFPNTEQWLQVVGLPSTAIKGLLNLDITLDKLLKMSPNCLAELMNSIGAPQTQTGMLNRALGKLRAWTESQMSDTAASDRHSDLFWTEPLSPSLPQSFQQPSSISSISRSSMSSISSDPRQQGSDALSLAHEPCQVTGSISCSASQPSLSGCIAPCVPSHHSQHSSTAQHGGVTVGNTQSTTATYSNGQPRSPVAPPLTPTQKGKSRPNTPPPQRRNVIMVPPGNLIKSHSHESQLSCRIPTDVNSARPPGQDDDERLFGSHSYMPAKSDSYPRRQNTPTHIGHRIEHRFETRSFKPGKCDYCLKKFFSARVCKHCKYKCHKECEPNVPQFSCGLTDVLVQKVSELIKDQHLHSSPLSNYNSLGSRGHDSRSIPDSSSASSYSLSSPSSPHVIISQDAYGSFSAQPSPASKQHFTFPQISFSGTVQSYISQREADDKDRLTCTVGSEDTVISSRGTIEFDAENITSHSSDQTCIDSNSSEKTLPENLDAKGDNSDLHSPMLRQPSLSKALEEWDIPYAELVIEDKLGAGHVGTVFKGQWHGPVAIKKIAINPAVDLESQLLAFKQEIATLKKTRHDNIVLFMGACMKPPELAIVTSYVNGATLYKETRANRWSLTKITSIASQTVQGMGYLHSKGIIHKQLTSKNIFVERGEKVVITDFGLSNISQLSSNETRRRGLMMLPQGWLSYLAPEVIRALRIENQQTSQELPFSKLSDTYAFGTIWYELLIGEWPFSSGEPEAVIWQVGNGLKPSFHSVHASREVQDVLMSCWHFIPEERPTFGELSILLERLPKRRLARSPSHPIQLSKSSESFFRSGDLVRDSN